MSTEYIPVGSCDGAERGAHSGVAERVSGRARRGRVRLWRGRAPHLGGDARAVGRRQQLGGQRAPRQPQPRQPRGPRCRTSAAPAADTAQPRHAPHACSPATTCCNRCHASSFTSLSSSFFSCSSTTASSSSTFPSGLSSSLSLLPRLLGLLSSDWDTLRFFTDAVRYSKSESDRSLDESVCLSGLTLGSSLMACRSSAASSSVTPCNAPASQLPPPYCGHDRFRQIFCFGASSSSVSS
ncbi:unnamed protein product [Chrysodeixis includens]|uniref:Uncharacterized protein n=1 Tax=Chrysodeixis includens TaxID=689277 RepID=A0A9N8Q0C4_CHRIL|nr:unnamed protein product [Chrysodeixis includens]